MASSGKKDYSKYKKLLLEMRSKIAGDLAHLEEDSLNKNPRDASGDLSGYSFHMADQATDNFDREFTLGLAANEQEILNMIDVALRKIEAGDYGICEACPKPIPQKRLQALPHAPMCIKCQEELEKENKRR